MFVVTDAWLMAHSAWTRDQFSCIGISWPPPRGWKFDVIGKTITDQQKTRFEQALRAKKCRHDATADMFT